ncbi:MAG: class I SAM-dependent methyltransferase [Deltaproteobacteria bacterium]|nr:class I SAM-dependent methyltransferase [Deltaproteobacteria bacterium]
MTDVINPLLPDSEIILLKKYFTLTLIRDWESNYRIDISSELKGIEEICLYRCKKSRLDFFYPVSASGGPELYKKLQNFDWFYMPEKWEFDEALKDLKDGGRLLEIGCGRGFFIEKVLNQFPEIMAKGIESNGDALVEPLEKGLPVEMARTTDLIERKELFDAVCSFQVLEHISSPRSFFDDVLKLLKPGGLLILCVPNKESFIKHQFNLLDMPPHHMTRWSLTTFKFLENIFPLKLEKASFEPLADYHIDWYLQTYKDFIRHKVRIPLVLMDYAAYLFKKRGLNRYCKGHSLYVRFKKL